MERPDNPARRLHKLYTSFEKHGGRGTTNNPTTAKDAWAAALDLKPKEELPELLAQFGVIVGLPKEIRERVKRLPEEEATELLGRHIPKFVRVLADYGIHARVREYRSIITSHEVESLLHIAQALDRQGAHEATVDAERVEKLRAEVATLLADVLDDDNLPPELRRFVLRHLERIERALRRLQVEGIDGLREALNLLAAEVIVDNTRPEEQRGGLWNFVRWTGGVGARLLSIVGQATQIVTLASGAPELVEWIANALTTGGDA